MNNKTVNSIYLNLRAWAILIVLIFYLSFLPKTTKSQTDTEFWFVVPEITIGHNHSSTPAGGVPAFLRFATFNLSATITISQPANPGFTPIVINMAANSSYNLNMSNYIAKLVGDVWTDQNILENMPLTADGKNNFGLHIQSTSPITAYYEINNFNNGEIWALKGKNALGKNFYTPFQQFSDNGNYTPQPYSSIDIVATENGTTITITPTKDAGYGNAGLFIPANVPFTFTLLKGQTISFFPRNFNKLKSNRLSGTHITSDKKIAISLKDDSISHFKLDDVTEYGCRDAIGDQLIPVDVAGVEYICTRTFLNDYDNIIILATQAATPIYIDGVLMGTLGIGQQLRYKFLGAPNIHCRITSRFFLTDPYKPIIVYHIGGFGCELGAAIVPPIDKCTGSTQVSFTRSNSTPLYLTILVRAGGEDDFLVDGVINNILINPSSFVTIPGTLWKVARFGINPVGIPISGFGSIPVGQHLISNTSDVFHIGILNGTAGSTCWFGYFSGFFELNPETTVVGSEGPDNFLCYGESAQLFASGGTKYEWTPTDFLNDPYSATPLATNVTRSIKYSVTVSGVCGLSATKDLDLVVSPEIVANFSTDLTKACAPVIVTFSNRSIGTANNSWDFNSDGDFADPEEGLNNSAIFSHVFDNFSNDTIRYNITLYSSDATRTCIKQITKSILVYPRIDAQFTTINTDPKNCHPLNISFNNTSTTNGSTYLWDFGDGETSNTENPTHVFNNFSTAPKIYNSKFVVTDKYNFCSDDVATTITVQPFIKANFVIDKTEGCSPLLVNVVDISQGGFNQSLWDRDGSGVYDYNTAGSWTKAYINPSITNSSLIIPIKLTVKNAAGCSDELISNVTINPIPQVNIGADQTICQGNSVMLNAGNSNSSFLWSTLSTDQTIIATTSGRYSVEVTNPQGCKATDEMVLTINPSPIVNLGPDRTIVEETELDAGPGFVSYLWQDNSQNQTITINSTGLYSVSVTDANNCKGYDEVSITKINPAEVIITKLISPPSHCFTKKGHPVTVEITNNSQRTFIKGDSINVIYQIGSATPVIETMYFTSIFSNGKTLNYTFSQKAVIPSDVVIIKMKTIVAGVDSKTSYFPITVKQSPNLDLGPDTLRTKLPYILKSGIGGVTYNWNTGSKNPSITVSIYGKYSLTVVNNNGCEAKDSIVFISPTTDIESTLGPNVKVSFFPNPVNEELTITIETYENDSFSIDIINTNGVIVKNIKTKKVQNFAEKINVLNYTPGIYFLKVANTKGIAVFKLIVQ